jgi:hypothetical protein
MANENESGGHWYTRDGTPAYTTNGRDTTLRDARKLQLVPSVTTFLNVLAKPALTAWLVNQGIMAALTMPRVDGESERTYIARILSDSKAQSLAAAQEGSRIHDAIECSFKGRVYPDKYIKHVVAAREAIAKQYPQVDDWVSEASFAHPLGFGGKCDLHSPSTGIIVDYKTKDGDFSDGKKLAYDQHYQLAAYQVGLGLRNIMHNEPSLPSLTRAAPGSALFVSRTHPGAVSLHEWPSDEMEQGWGIAVICLQLWKLTKGFDPGWTS